MLKLNNNFFNKLELFKKHLFLMNNVEFRTNKSLSFYQKF